MRRWVESRNRTLRAAAAADSSPGQEISAADSLRLAYSGQVWEHADPDWLRRWVESRTARFSGGRADLFDVSVSTGRLICSGGQCYAGIKTGVDLYGIPGRRSVGSGVSSPPIAPSVRVDALNRLGLRFSSPGPMPPAFAVSVTRAEARVRLPNLGDILRHKRKLSPRKRLFEKIGT